jgi:hypothetical protein
MLTLLFYVPLADGPPLDRHTLEEALELPGVELDGARGDAYRPGRWRDAATGATAVIDLGTPPLEEDHLHPPRAYDGWRPAELTMQIPVTGPHWLAVECLQFAEAVLARLPDLRALDTEDIRQDHGEGPGPWSRPRALASWERQHQQHQLGRTDQRRMARLASVCLWRYRRERSAGLLRYPELAWPEALVLLDQELGVPRTAALWQDPGRALALPPVELLVVQRAGGAGVLPAEQLAALGAEPLPVAQAARIPVGEGPRGLASGAPLLPVARFRALADHDWSD